MKTTYYTHPTKQLFIMNILQIGAKKIAKFILKTYEKFPSLLQGYVLSMNIPTRKEEGSYVYSLKE
jgi:hypothetical protein